MKFGVSLTIICFLLIASCTEPPHQEVTEGFNYYNGSPTYRTLFLETVTAGALPGGWHASPTGPKPYSILSRFDSDLSLDLDDKRLKQTETHLSS